MASQHEMVTRSKTASVRGKVERHRRAPATRERDSSQDRDSFQESDDEAENLDLDLGPGPRAQSTSNWIIILTFTFLIVLAVSLAVGYAVNQAPPAYCGRDVNKFVPLGDNVYQLTFAANDLPCSCLGSTMMVQVRVSVAKDEVSTRNLPATQNKNLTKGIQVTDFHTYEL